MRNSETAAAPAHRRRILFLAEAVTLAHVARPVALATSLDPTRYDVILAVDPRYNRLLGDLPFPVRPLQSIPSEQFLAALAAGRPLYNAETLRSYIRDDLEVMRATTPDVVVGDFRLSLAVSGRVARVPYLALANAYWSPYARQRFPLPELPLTRALGPRLARPLFQLIRPLAFAYHTRPLNRVRREYGLPSLGWDLRRIYTEADHVGYADVPEMVPTYDLPPNHHYLGPILWSPPIPLPGWWKELPVDRAAVYVTLGSSGRRDLLAVVLRALADLPVSVLAATAGHPSPERLPANAWVSDYLPGAAATARSQFVICNGGSPTTQQALAAGRPVLGLASNMDQHSNMEAVRRCGAGRLLRVEQADIETIRRTVNSMLGDAALTEGAAALAAVLRRYPASVRFEQVIAEMIL